MSSVIRGLERITRSVSATQCAASRLSRLGLRSIPSRLDWDVFQVVDLLTRLAHSHLTQRLASARLAMRLAIVWYEAVSPKDTSTTQEKEVYEALWQGTFTGVRYLYIQRTGRTICAQTEPFHSFSDVPNTPLRFK